MPLLIQITSGRFDRMMKFPVGRISDPCFMISWSRSILKRLRKTPDDLLERKETGDVIVKTMDAYRVEDRWRPQVCRIVADTLTTPVSAVEDSFVLGRLKQEDRIHEVEFYYPFAFPVGEPLKIPDCDIVAGRRCFIRGFVDLVFRYKGKFFIADWKSNRLDGGYGRKALDDCMDAAGYHLQYKLYTVAVLRWLKQAFGDRFDPDSQFGGVFYFFLRGMGTGNGNGVYFVSPTEIGTLEHLESEIAKSDIGDHSVMTVFNAGEDQLIQQLVAFKIFEGTEKATIALLEPFIRRLELSLLDYMTIRDLVEFGDCRGDLPLVVVLMAMFAGLQEGSLCLDLDQRQFLSQLPADDRKTATTVFDDFLSGLAAGRYQKLITKNGAEYLPLILDASSGRDLLYFQKYHVHEKRLKDRIEAFLKATVSLTLPDQKIDARIDEIYADQLAIRVGPTHSPIAKDPQQIEAIRLALKSQFSIISGGPGTGKTSLMVNILRCLVREGIPVSRIILGAPTGRAAQRMTETVQNNIASIQELSDDDAALLELKGSTLHKILGYRSYQHEFYYRETNPLPASVVVVDEVSMVDVVMLDKFLQAIDPAQTKLILLGDKNQLPSVEAGSVFAEMIPDGTRAARFEERFVVLQKVYRSGTHLLELANQANQGSFPPFKAVAFDKALSQASDQWAFVNAENFGQWQEHLHQWVNVQYLQSDIRW